MVILSCITMFADSTTKYNVCQWISGCLNFASTVYKVMWMLGCIYRIQHNGEITTGRVLHTGCNVKTADSQTVLLILNRTCTDGNVREEIFYISPVLRVKHFVCTGKTTLSDRTDVHFTHSNETFYHIRCFFRVWLGCDTFVTFACCTRFVCVNTRNDDQLIFDIFLDFCEAADIVANRIFIVRGTWSDDNKKTGILSGDDIGNHSITLLL